MFDLSGYHLLLAGFGLAVIVAYWLPRFVSVREPAASALLIGMGWLVFGFMPGMPEAISPVSQPRAWEVVSELCVVVGLFGVGLRIDKVSELANWTPTIRLLALAMPLTILGVALLGWAAASMTLAAALLLGAVLAPTDPVLASDVQVGRPTKGGEHPVRFTLTTEAGLNDGLAFPFVYLALAVAAAGAATPNILAEWVLRDVAYRIVVGVAGGLGVGWLLGRILFAFPHANPLAKTEAGVVALAGVLAAYGATELAEGYGFIAAFVSGVTLRRARSEHEFHVRLHAFSENIEHALTAALLIALGAALPALLQHLTPTGLGIALGLIFLVRPLAGWLSLLGGRLRGGERVVVAAYGVRGVGSIYYLSYAGSHAELTNEAELWAITGATILVSTVAHGFTASLALERVTGEKPAKEA